MAQDTMFGEDMENEELHKLLRGDHVMGQDEESLFCHMINNDQNGCITRR